MHKTRIFDAALHKRVWDSPSYHHAAQSHGGSDCAVEHGCSVARPRNIWNIYCFSPSARLVL